MKTNLYTIDSLETQNNELLISQLADANINTVSDLIQNTDNISTEVATRLIKHLYGQIQNNDASRYAVIESSTTGLNLANNYANLKQEELHVLYLDTRNNVIEDFLASKGTINSSMFSPRDILRRALEVNATGFITAHNHPSGSLQPSKEDLSSCYKLQDASKLMGVKYLDNFIVSKEGYISFKEDKIF